MHAVQRARSPDGVGLWLFVVPAAVVALVGVIALLLGATGRIVLKGLVAGSPLRFQERGVAELKGRRRRTLRLYDRVVDEFVPHDFDVPRRLETSQFVLEPLGSEHNEQDYDAWTSSREHIHSTPGWEDSKWPREMTPDENRADLERHADDFRNRKGFTYTALDPASREVIGCVYIYPARDGDHDARAFSWVRASHAELDAPLWRAVSEWLASDWPFGSVEYAPRA